MDDSLMFASSLGGNIFSIALAISIVPFFVIPAILAWRKMSMVVYVTYFISLNIPITIVTIGASGALEFFYVIINQTFNAPISFTHFLLSSAIVMAQSLAMSYYMHQAIRLQQHRK
ncbi:MAG: hypothetical protein Q7S11_03395 [bacterium]|nr:hypothetical protein [bacterium]